MPEMDRVCANATPISEEQDQPGISGALDVAARFGLKAAAAKAILGEVYTAVSSWRSIGRKLRINAATLNTYASAFEHEFMAETGRLLKR